jgi:hypothetical protein
MYRIFKRDTAMRVVTTSIFGAFLLLSGGAVCKATTVYFNDADRGPAGTLQISGITITPYGAGQPTTVLGVGLGLDEGIGPMSEANQQAHWSAGMSAYDSFATGGGLSFQVDGWINSITLAPVLRIYSGTGDLMPIPDGLNLEFHVNFPFGEWPIIPVDSNAPVTLTDLFGMQPSTCLVTPQSSWGADAWFSSYRQDHLSEEQTIQWGFTVISVDYTPVPEPGAFWILAIGLIGLWCARQAGRRRATFIRVEALSRPVRSGRFTRAALRR